MTAVAGDGVGWSHDDIVVVARDGVAVVWTESSSSAADRDFRSIRSR